MSPSCTATAGPPAYIAGLDLGQVRDFSALALLEKMRSADQRGRSVNT
jgi:hypothetical protein